MFHGMLPVCFLFASFKNRKKSTLVEIQRSIRPSEATYSILFDTTTQHALRFLRDWPMLKQMLANFKIGCCESEFLWWLYCISPSSSATSESKHLAFERLQKSSSHDPVSRSINLQPSKGAMMGLIRLILAKGQRHCLVVERTPAMRWPCDVELPTKRPFVTLYTNKHLTCS